MMPKILIVEDDAVLLNTLKFKLEKEGYRVATATDGEAAMRQIVALRPDVICLDILLPKKSGMEVLEDLQKYPDLKSIPVIIISNSGQPVELSRATALGVKDVLIKANFTPDELLQKIAKLVPPPAGGPTAAAAVAAETPAAVPAQDQSPGQTILVVEDDVFLRRLLAEKLKHEGFAVAEAANGGEAKEFLAVQTPALILLDLMMPGTDGFQLLAEFKSDAAVKDIPVIVLSNLGEKEHIERAMALGAVDYMIKAHFVLDEIVAKIKGLIK